MRMSAPGLCVLFVSSVDRAALTRSALLTTQKRITSSAFVPTVPERFGRVLRSTSLTAVPAIASWRLARLPRCLD